MKIVTITDRTEWEQFIDENAVTTFMQSWSWGEFEEQCAHEVHRIGVVDGDSLVAVTQSVLIRSKRGTFLYVPHGPVIRKDILPWSAWTSSESQRLDSPDYTLIDKIVGSTHHALVDYARTKHCAFIRVNSSLPNEPQFHTVFKNQGYRIAPIYLTSENAAVLSLVNKDADALLGAMRKTTRYLVHKAQKEQVTISVDTSSDSIEEFMKLYNLTTKREKFVGFGDEYIKKEFEAFGKYGNAVLLHAYHKAQILATALVLFTNNSAFYHQGASNHPKVPAPYLLQWQAIQLAIQRGCKYYNFWGTYIRGRTPKSWHGLSLFKSGFGTQIWSYLPTFDYPLNSFYYLTYLYEHYIRLRRGV